MQGTKHQRNSVRNHTIMTVFIAFLVVILSNANSVASLAISTTTTTTTSSTPTKKQSYSRPFAYQWLPTSCFYNGSKHQRQKKIRTGANLCTLFSSSFTAGNSSNENDDTGNAAAAAAAAFNDSSSNNNKSKIQNKRGKRILLVWVHVLSIFVAANYFRSTLWPSSLLKIPNSFWALLHGLGAMTFSGGVLTTTLLEWNLPSLLSFIRSNDNMTASPTKRNAALTIHTTDLLRWLWQIESALVLPGVTISMVSGVIQAHQNYGTFRYAPKHVKSALHIMLLFGAWWAWTDKRSQRGLQKQEQGGSGSGSTDILNDETKLIQRRFSNVVSCVFLFALYGVMILKPGYVPN